MWTCIIITSLLLLSLSLRGRVSLTHSAVDVKHVTRKEALKLIWTHTESFIRTESTNNRESLNKREEWRSSGLSLCWWFLVRIWTHSKSLKTALTSVHELTLKNFKSNWKDHLCSFSNKYIIVVLRCWFVVGVLSSISVTGYSGGGVTIRCRYYEGYTDNTKYFCRGQWSECTNQIKTNTKNKWVDSERFSLYDDTRAAVFTVTIRDLSEQDSGTYYCGTDISWYKDPYTEVNLKVITGE